MHLNQATGSRLPAGHAALQLPSASTISRPNNIYRPSRVNPAAGTQSTSAWPVCAVPNRASNMSQPPTPGNMKGAALRSLSSLDSPTNAAFHSLGSLDCGQDFLLSGPVEGVDSDISDSELSAADLISAAGLTSASDSDENPYTSQDAAVSLVLDGAEGTDSPAVDSTIGLGGMGGEVEVERLLAEGGADLSVERVCKIFQYPLDSFQKKALDKLLDGESVVVCAPTGAGKTAIAEAGAAACLAKGLRVIYTTPLKALSNQKLFEMRKRFGHVRCGLQTGDTSLNTEAQVVIMTTEILRNIMYRIAEEQSGGGGYLGGNSEDTVDSNSASNLAARELRLGDVGLVVMDEVHYLADKHRGTVWEEAIINCPRHIQLLCMSATVKNPDDLGAWISKEHMQCSTIKTSYRPVPLHWWHAYTAPPPRGLQLVDLLSKDCKSLNPKLESKAIHLEEARAMLQRGGGMDDMYFPRGGSRTNRRDDPYASERSLVDMMGNDQVMQRKTNAKRVPNIEALIVRMHKQAMLPAIWFILSRKECDLQTMRMSASTVALTTDAEQALIRIEAAALQADQPEAMRDNMLPALIKGVSSHHAGCLPGWKGMVERLFQRGLLKLVFATGTLAAGINMPARTTIIGALGRKTDDGFQLLPHNEMLQMAGRAGRRGYDTEGSCIVVQTRFEGPEEAWSILRAGPEPLVSQFNVSYGLVLNLLSVYSLEQARQFCNKSFGIYLREEGNVRKKAEVSNLEARASDILERFAATATTTAKELNMAVVDAKEKLQAVREKLSYARMQTAHDAIQEQGLPRKVVLSVLVDRTKGSKRSVNVSAVLVSLEPHKGSEPEQFTYLGLGADNRLVRANAMHVAGLLNGPEGSLGGYDTEQVEAATAGVRPTAWQLLSADVPTMAVTSGNNATAVIALALQPKMQWTELRTSNALAKQLEAAKEDVRSSLAALDQHRKVNNADGAGTAADRSAISQMATARTLQKRAESLKQEILAADENTWRNFTEVVSILMATNALEKDTLRVLPLGLVARSIQGQNELWLALVLTHPAVIGLSGPEFAGLLGAILSAEVLRKGGMIDTAYPASQRVVDAVDQLEESRQHLSDLQSDASMGQWNDMLLVDLRLAGIVEAWAAGATWQQIMADCAIDDGDLARLLIRTVDLLKQISWQTELLPYLKDSCLEALRGMERKPIAESLI